jgi:hypothetical protein
MKYLPPIKLNLFPKLKEKKKEMVKTLDKVIEIIKSLND